MIERELLLSSQGLRNLVLSKDADDQFTFHFGDKIFTTNKILAEFLSPTVSHIHYSDPTIQDIYYQDHDFVSSSARIPKLSTIITETTVSQLQQLLSGYPVSFTQEQSQNLRLISIILQNVEFFKAINKVYPLNDKNDEETNLDYIMDMFELTLYFHKRYDSLQMEDIIDQISSQFYLIDRNRLKILPLQIIYEIISNKNLKIESEDSLLDFIDELFEGMDTKSCDLNKYSFYEYVEFSHLSESKFSKYLNDIDINQITESLWTNLKTCFYNNIKNSRKSDRSRYSKSSVTTIEYNKDLGNCFNGIIQMLTNEFGGNVDDKNVVKITSSSVLREGYDAKNVANFGIGNFFHSEIDEFESWLKFDFKERKVCPSSYSLKTANDSNSSPRSWVLEGSNSVNGNEWTVIDQREVPNMFLPRKPKSENFEIQNKTGEFYRYLRLKTTERNNNNHYYFAISAVEFFGSIE